MMSQKDWGTPRKVVSEPSGCNHDNTKNLLAYFALRADTHLNENAAILNVGRTLGPQLGQIWAMEPLDLGHNHVMSRWPLLIQNPHGTSRDWKLACQIPSWRLGLKLGGRYWRSLSALMSIVPVLSVV